MDLVTRAARLEKRELELEDRENWIDQTEKSILGVMFSVWLFGTVCGVVLALLIVLAKVYFK